MLEIRQIGEYVWVVTQDGIRVWIRSSGLSEWMMTVPDNQFVGSRRVPHRKWVAADATLDEAIEISIVELRRAIRDSVDAR